MRVFVVITVHNRKEYTRACLNSLRKQANSAFSVVLVDDGSTDGTREMIRNEFPEITLLEGDGRLWWTGATNLGIQHVLQICQPDDYVLLLNNDLVLPLDYIGKALEVAAQKPDSLIGSVVTHISEKDRIYKGGVKINWKTARWTDPNAGKKLSEFPTDYILEVSTLTGRGVLIPTEVFKIIGLYNIDHFLQCGDTELPVRAARADYRLVVSYNMVVYSYPNDKNHINYKDEYRLSDMKEFFLSIKSNTNLKYRYWFARSISTNKWLVVRYLIFDMTRVVSHFFRHVKLI